MGSGSTRRALIGSFAALSLAQILMAGAAWAGCRADQVELRWPGGQARFAVEVADTDATRSRGLMFRERLPRSAGMLFVYESPRRATFWMKNTLIPLDMIFADASGRVTKVHANAQPQDLTTIDGGAGVKLVLEINGGLSSRLGITPGAELRHPAIDNPAWSCAE
ncbi:MAG: DUF192 domain-containing protein [Pseudorhodobacter sp.]|nr:DUF192 domain-containing protein [Pseudorhodobacter sp.]